MLAYPLTSLLPTGLGHSKKTSGQGPLVYGITWYLPTLWVLGLCYHGKATLTSHFCSILDLEKLTLQRPHPTLPEIALHFFK